MGSLNSYFGTKGNCVSMNLNIQEKKHKKNIGLFCRISFAICYALYCFAFAPLYIIFSNDALYKNGMLPNIMSLLYTVTEIVAISVSFGTLIYSIYRFGLKKSKFAVVIYVVAMFSKNIANMCMDYFFSGALPLGTEILSDIGWAILTTLLDCLHLALFLPIAAVIISRAKRGAGRESVKGSDTASSFENDRGIYPFTGMIDLKNPLLKAGFWGGMIILISKTVSQLIFDIFSMAVYGLPEKAMTVVNMILAYIPNIAMGAVCYFIVMLTLMRCFSAYDKQTAFDK